MATNWPTSRDTFTNPTSGDTLDSPSHAAQHANINDAVEAMQLYAGLVLVKTQTVGTAVSSVTVNNAFSSTFDHYRIVLMGGVASGFATLSLQLGSVTTGYYGASIGASYITGTPNGQGDNNTGSWSYAGFASTSNVRLVCDVFSPNLATRTTISAGWTYYLAQSSYSIYVGEVLDTNARTAFVIAPSSGTLTGGTIRVYGYNNG